MDKTLKIALTTGVMTLGIVITATPVDAATMTTQQQAFVNKMTPAILRIQVNMGYIRQFKWHKQPWKVVGDRVR